MMKRLKGFQTYIAVIGWIAYEAAVKNQILPEVMLLREAFVGAIIILLRAGSKRDAAKAVTELKKPDVPAV